MILKQLNNFEIQSIYNRYLIHDFPKDETRPLQSIYDLKKVNRYSCYGAYDHNKLVGYAFFTKSIHDQEYLMDYLAVIKNVRNKGYGSKIIQLIKKEFSNEIIFAEVETIHSTNNPLVQAQRERRIAFYQKNDFKISDVESIVYGVNYQMIYLSNITLTNNSIYQKVNDLYLYLFGKERYQQHIQVILKKEL